MNKSKSIIRFLAGKLMHVSFLIIVILSNILIVSAAQTWYRQNGGTATISNQVFTSSVNDTSGVFVTNGGVLTMTNCQVKTTGNTSSNDNSSFYGLNAGILVNGASTATITGCNIYTSGEGGNGIFSTGKGSSVILVDDTITCLGSGGHGVDATYEGTMTLTNVIIYTEESHGAAISTDRGGGTINVTGGKAIAAGIDSPGIYCTGTITATDAIIGATGSEGVVIEGANSVTMTNVTMSGAKGTRNRANLIYQSMSGDAEGKEGKYTMTGGSFTWQETGPFFLVTNTTAYINLTGVTINNSSDTLCKSAADNWGTSGSNGGTTYITAVNQALTGLIYTDKISTTSLTLKTNSILTGATNKAAVSIDETSRWNLTTTSYVTTFTDASGISGDSVTNVTGNGYSIIYDSTLTGNSYLGKKTYKLTGGGYLTCGSLSTAVTDESASVESVMIFPNPATTEINILSNTAQNQKLQIWNIYGATMYIGTITGNVTIDVSSWVSGVYFAVINGKVSRFIVGQQE